SAKVYARALPPRGSRCGCRPRGLEVDGDARDEAPAGSREAGEGLGVVAVEEVRDAEGGPEGAAAAARPADAGQDLGGREGVAAGAVGVRRLRGPADRALDEPAAHAAPGARAPRVARARPPVERGVVDDALVARGRRAEHA